MDALKHPELVGMLVNATVSWCSVSVNREVLKRLLEPGARRGAGDRHGGPHAAPGGEHGDGRLSSTASRIRKWRCRGISRLQAQGPRHPVLDEAQDVTLWGALEAGVTERHIALTDDMAMLALTMDLAEAPGLPMSVVWAACSWIDRG